MRKNLADIFGPAGFDSRLPFEPQEPPEILFACQLKAFGIIADLPLRVGAITRCKMADQPKSGNRSGWYLYFGDSLVSGIAGGVFGDWREQITHHWSSKSDREMTAQERAAYDKALAMAREKQDAERRQRQEEAAQEAQKMISSATLAIGHDYLTRKQAKAYGVYSDGSALLVPMRNIEGEIRSVQRIYPNSDKRFLAGGEVTGCFHLIGSAYTEPTYIVEGYATGATVHELTGKAVVVAFNAGNLAAVVRAIREAGNPQQLIIAADNDRHTEGNPGLSAAEKAAGDYFGVSVVAPDFIGTEGSDFNDLYIAEGPEAVLRSLKAGKPSDAAPLLIHAADLKAHAPSWLVKGVLPATGIGVLFGPSGGGKSFAVIDVALHIASGRDWHGRQTKRSGAVIYVCGEGQQGVGNRLRAWAKHNAVDLDAVPVYVTRVPVRFLDPASTTALLNAIADTAEAAGDVALIVIDTLNRNFGDGDENTTKDMTRFVDAVTDVQKQLDTTMLIVHHTGLGDGERARGSSALRAALDFEIQLKPAEECNQFSLIGRKMKDGSDMVPAHFQMTFVELGIDEDGEAFGSCAIEPMAEDKMSASATADSLMDGDRQKKLLAILREMRAEILANKPDAAQIVVEKSALNAAMKARGIPANKTTEIQAKFVQKNLLFPLSAVTYHIPELD